MLNDIDLIVFDLDGTLYEDTDHFEYYANQLAQFVPEANREAYFADYQRMLAGEHPLKIGKVYDRATDTILTVDRNLQVVGAVGWDGAPSSSPWPVSPVTPDFEGQIAVGDGWWLPAVCARHYGATNTKEAYEATKRFMASPAFQLTKIPGLKEALERVRQPLVLLTNSTPDDVARLLDRLDLVGLWAAIYDTAQKPTLTQKWFRQIAADFGVPLERILSVGDNYLNEIANVEPLGVKTLFIDPYGLEYPEYTGPKVRSLSEVLEVFSKPVNDLL